MPISFRQQWFGEVHQLLVSDLEYFHSDEETWGVES